MRLDKEKVRAAVRLSAATSPGDATLERVDACEIAEPEAAAHYEECLHSSGSALRRTSRPWHLHAASARVLRKVG
jgi:hypothetical protein